MAKTKMKSTPPARTPKPIPPLRTWEVVLDDGTSERVSAHDCSTYNDALSFTGIASVDAKGERDWVTVRGFSTHYWRTVRLIEEPVPTPSVEGAPV